LDAQINDIQSELSEAVETALEIAAYEPDEGEKVTPAVIKKALKVLIDDLKGSSGKSAKKELKALQDQDNTIKAFEIRIKDTKAALKKQTDELDLKIQLKRIGGEDFKAENKELIRQVDEHLVKLDPANKTDKRKINAINKDKAVLEARIAKTEELLTAIGGQLTEEEAHRLILKKIYVLVSSELNRYLDAEKRSLVQLVVNLWDKYAISSCELEKERNDILKALDSFLNGLGYLK